MTQEMASVALISAVDPYPVDAGKKVVLAGFVQYFVDRLGPENTHYLLIGGQDRPEFPARLHALPKPRPAAALGNALIRSGTGRASLQESLLRDAKVGSAIESVLAALQCSLEVYDTVRTGQYAAGERSHQQICYLDDLFSERYAAMLDAARRFPDVEINPLGNFAAHVPERMHFLAEVGHAQRTLLRVERRLIARSEDHAAHRFVRCLLVNDEEAALLRSRAGADAGRLQTVPPLVAAPESAPRSYAGKPEFVFLGLLSLPHNDDGLRWFLTSVWPKVLAERPGAKLHILGKDPLPHLTRAAADHTASATFHGFVPDLTEILGRSAAMINPLRFGSGVKLKVIESLGRGIPVVSTPVGASGLASGADQGILVADDAAEFAQSLLDVTTPSLNTELSDAARAHFAHRYSREAVFAAYDAAFAI